jgi:putative ABC transport system substrate-binding protein
VGYLVPASLSVHSSRLEAFRQGLRELGYVEGKSIRIEYRYAEGKQDRLNDLAAELVRLKVDVIVTSSTPGVLAVKRASTTIPIVFAAIGDPVRSGLVASLARPGGNITGLTILAPELSGKRLELLKEVFPKATRVAILWNATGPALSHIAAQAAAKALGLELLSLEVRDADDIESAFEGARRRGPQALVTTPGAVIDMNQKKIVDFAAKSRLPAMYAQLSFVDAGGLMAYAPSATDLWHRAALYVDKILKGAKPADLPVEQPTKFEFVINLKTAKQIGLTIPPNVLARADKVIK